MEIQNPKLKTLRVLKELSPDGVAQELGVSPTTVRNWEKGRTIPKLRFDQTEQLCKLYGVSFEELMAAVRESGCFNSKNP